MSNITTNHPTPSWFQDFKDRILGGIRSAEDTIQRTAALYVEAITKDPTFKDWISEEVPEVSGGIWRTLEMVGRGQLDARIAAGGCPFGNKLRRLPVSEQKQALDGTIPLLTVSGDTLQVRLDALHPPNGFGSMKTIRFVLPYILLGLAIGVVLDYLSRI